jgi:hypothetical protein
MENQQKMRKNLIFLKKNKYIICPKNALFVQCHFAIFCLGLWQISFSVLIVSQFIISVQNLIFIIFLLLCFAKGDRKLMYYGKESENH